MIGRRIKSLRKEKGLTQGALALRMGLTQQAVGKWETGRSSPDYPMLVRLARALEVEPESLFDPADFYPLQGDPVTSDTRPFLPYNEKLVPVLGTVRAGYGLPAEEEALGLEPADVKDPSRFFYLVVQGESMEPMIHDRDLALVRKQPSLDDGDLGVIVFGDGEGTIKRFYQKGDTVALQAFNPAYETLILSGSELEQMHIVGKVIETKTRW